MIETSLSGYYNSTGADSSGTSNLHFMGSILSLVGSSISTIACAFTIAVFLTVLPSPEVNVRTKLVLNLLVSEGLNALNNSVSGILYVFQSLPQGIGCTINGFIGQTTVQAVDLNVLTITIVTYLVLGSDSMNQADRVMSFCERYLPAILALVWLIPLLTASINFGIAGYGPVGNYCWISDPDSVFNTAVARYSLTHGPRVLIFVTIILLYSILILYLYRKTNQSATDLHQSSQGEMTSSLNSRRLSLPSSPASASYDSQLPALNIPLARQGSRQAGLVPSNRTSFLSSLPAPVAAASPSPLHSTKRLSWAGLTSLQQRRESATERIESIRQKKLRDAIFRLVAFPAAFVIMWLPGMVNRILDAVQATSDMSLLFQSITQFLGLMHAIICLWNLHVVLKMRQETSPSPAATYQSPQNPMMRRRSSESIGSIAEL